MANAGENYIEYRRESLFNVIIKTIQLSILCVKSIKNTLKYQCLNQYTSRETLFGVIQILCH